MILIDDSEKLREGSELNKQNAYTLVVKSKSAFFGQKKKKKQNSMTEHVIGLSWQPFLFFFFFSIVRRQLGADLSVSLCFLKEKLPSFQKGRVVDF